MGIITNKYNLPDSIVKAVTGSNSEYSGPQAQATKISVTTLINPPRIHYLRCAHYKEITEDVSENIWRLLGSAVHYMLEQNQKETNTITEERINKEINGITISGAFDLYDSTTKEIHDYKTTSAYSVVYNPTGKPEWISQLNIYSWLLESIGFPVLGMKIIAILRDWSESKYVPGGNYPEIPIAVIDIPKWDKEKIEKYINERVALFKNCSLMQEHLLPFCSDTEMWAKETTWAIMKEGRKSAVKVCATEQEAKDNCASGCTIVARPGDRLRCSRYCQVSKWCNQYQEYLKEKL